MFVILKCVFPDFGMVFPIAEYPRSHLFWLKDPIHVFTVITYIYDSELWYLYSLSFKIVLALFDKNRSRPAHE
jgi:hypothetical protein